MGNSVYLFVYGTLRPPLLNSTPDDVRYHHLIQAHILRHQPATLEGARLYDIGSYPAIEPGDGLVYGDLLLLAPDGLPIADVIEGHPDFYKREKTIVQVADGPIEAWIYWAPSGLSYGKAHIANGDWLRRGEIVLDEQPRADIAPTVEDETLQVLVQRFAEADCSWVSSVRPNGRVHSVPIWHVWYRGRIYLVIAAKSVKAINFEENPSVVIAHPDPHDPIIIEGWAIEANHLRDMLQPFFLEKYKWNIATDNKYDCVVEITPTKLMAWGKYGEGRWRGQEIICVW